MASFEYLINPIRVGIANTNVTAINKSSYYIAYYASVYFCNNPERAWYLSRKRRPLNKQNIGSGALYLWRNQLHAVEFESSTGRRNDIEF